MLPWGANGTLAMFGVVVGGGTLSQTLYIDDPALRSPVTITPGASISGDLNLDHTLRHFDATRSNSAVVVVWQYSLFDVAGRLHPVVTGAAVSTPSKTP